MLPPLVGVMDRYAITFDRVLRSYLSGIDHKGPHIRLIPISEKKPTRVKTAMVALAMIRCAFYTFVCSMFSLDCLAAGPARHWQ